MNSISPFADTRFEHEIRHLYYLQDDLYAALQHTKPCYLIGSRGTGKTTLLRSLSWRERSTNESLKRKLGQHTFSDFIAVYIKIPEVQIDGISDWLKRAEPSIRRAIYSRYLELIQLQEIFDATAELQVLGEVEYAASTEQEAVRHLLSEFGPELYLSEVVSRPPVSFSELSSGVRNLRRYVEKASQQSSDPVGVLDKIGAPMQLGQLSRKVAERLISVMSSVRGAGPSSFKVCFDEAETLDDFGVSVLGTWVRLSTAPLHHVVSFVSKPESLSETLLPNLTVQSADVAVLDLDRIKDKEFRAFAEGVTTLRLREFMRRSGRDLKQLPHTFDTEQAFGKLNINFLLEDALRESVSPFAKDLLQMAEAQAGPQAHGTSRIRRGDDSALPIYETYLSLRLNRSIPGESAPRWSKRRASSQLVRKAMVAAYLSIMSDLRLAPKYAYADMILQLSDSCIRDFLNNLDHVFRESRMSIDEFIRTKRLKATVQSSGLLAASKAKVKSLPTHGVNHPSSTAKLVNGLGKLTQLLQTQSKDGVRHLKTTERGIFELATSDPTSASTRAVTLVIEAAEAGFLKVLSHTELLIAFRIHTSLAPAFGSSYRGAYYPVPLRAQHILAFADASDDQAIQRAAMGLFERVDDLTNGELFPGAAL